MTSVAVFVYEGARQRDNSILILTRRTYSERLIRRAELV